MITSYQFKNLESGGVGLFLYMDESFEFSLDFLSKFREFDWDSFFRKHGMSLNGCKVFLVVGGVVLALVHSPVVKAREGSFPEFVTHNALFSEKVDVSENKNSELLSYLNRFLESSSVAKLYEEKNVDSNVSNEKQEAVERVENNKNPGAVNSSVENNKNDSNKHTSNNNNSISGGVNSSHSSNNQASGSIGGKNQGEVKEEVKEEAKEEVRQDETKQEENTSSGMMVQVHRSNGTVLEIGMEEYLVGVVASEMPASFSVEALKVQSILARTYAMKRIEAGGILTDTVQTQRYMDTDEMRKMWGSGFDKYYQKIKSAVDATKGKVVLYNGDMIDAVYHSTSNGRTEDAIFVWGNAFPYLVSVDSSWDRNVSSFSRSVSFDVEKLCSIFGVSKEDLSFQILSRNESGRVESIRIGEKIYTGVEVRTLLGLRSSDFDVSYSGEKVIFQTRGYGHGVGLSQYGANEMARLGYSYLDIIKHYYTGVTVGSVSG